MAGGHSRDGNEKEKTMKFRGIINYSLMPALVLAAGSVMAAPTEITVCNTYITEPGNYRLVNDLVDCISDEEAGLSNGINILVSDVTLDLGGHTIQCDATTSPDLVAGVMVGWWLNPVVTAPLENVRVHNGTIMGCHDGVLLSKTIGARVTRMAFQYNRDGAISLWNPDGGTHGSLIKNNRFMENGSAIRSWFGDENTYSHNVMSFGDAGIDLQDETDSIIKCNTVTEMGFGVALGPYSSGNEIRGNVVYDNWVSGIFMYGLEGMDWVDDEWQYWFQPVPTGNLIRNNIALGNSERIDGFDLLETVFSFIIGGWPLPPGDTCQNTWMNNQFDVELAPPGCIGPPVVLDVEEVCALDED
jgi:hypothetical protein